MPTAAVFMKTPRDASRHIAAPTNFVHFCVTHINRKVVRWGEALLVTHSPRRERARVRPPCHETCREQRKIGAKMRNSHD